MIKKTVGKTANLAKIAVIGGSGFYDLIKNPKWIEIKTPYGKTSDKIAIGKIANQTVAFLPRHGKAHHLPPHKINYRANLWALKSIGVKQIIAPCACGSLQENIKPGEFVICDQFVDRTKSRADTFFEGPHVAHVSAAAPYCPSIRDLLYKSCLKNKIKTHKTGTVVVIEGPRYSTKSESRWFSSQGWEVINMTQYPECILARELEMCYANIALITDYDAGLEGNKNIKPVTSAEVLRVFKQNNEKVKKVVIEAIKNIDKIHSNSCDCNSAMKDAFLS
ncbi:MAG: methylthioadenosine phosphorylase, 5'-methylthioadenosine phosphorylase [Candidatus Peregrinibacteria bacterium GW2011_GWC2_39_14]|nr:MAG: Purine nucleoside phosphorylase [Candidatus Peregrinibacteria bacterium GW2011_GWA2_38_36]KKR05925.1 MAG: methylthioadenosine phosphorylase, 5'-methylthioadenosine phosphorylase [Candidatus Peregrinibacteria bacterium GW2011_GWC2_39_14]